MFTKENLLNNVECEYKYGLNAQYADCFLDDFIAKFNELIAFNYEGLSQEFRSEHDLKEFFADKSKVKCEVLKNEYFDTEDDLLFKEFNAGLRLRRSSLSSSVEQTLKFKTQDMAAGASHTHIETTVNVDASVTAPDVSLFDSNLLPNGFASKVQAKSLICKYLTDFERCSLVLSVPRFACFELALDRGSIISGDISTPICEVEFELKNIDKQWLDENWGVTVYDLDDVRLQFSSFIDEVLLLVAGSSTIFIDRTGMKYEGPTDIYAHSKSGEAPDLDSAGFDDHIVCANFFTSDVVQKIPSLPFKKGGLIYAEPLSKLRRAVLLSIFKADNPGYKIGSGDDACISVERGTRVDADAFRKAVVEYGAIPSPTLAQFGNMVTYMTKTYSLAVGLANLFGTEKHFDDVRKVLACSITFATDHKLFNLTDELRIVHRRMAQDLDLSDLSMLAVSECSSIFIEFNVKMWFEPFYLQLSRSLDSDPDFNVHKFKELNASAVNNSYSIKSAEYIERVNYMLKRKNMILTCEYSNEDEFKSLAFATQYHTKQSWESVNLSPVH